MDAIYSIYDVTFIGVNEVLGPGLSVVDKYNIQRARHVYHFAKYNSLKMERNEIVEVFT